MTQVVHAGRLRANAARLRAAIGPGVQLLAVVKANAYGHGAAVAARAALAGGATRLGVATIAEAVELREAGFDVPVHVLGALAPEDLDWLVPYRVTPTLCDAGLLPDLVRAARRGGRRIPVHVKVDTGMARLGLGVEGLADAAARVLDEPSLRLEGVATHLASADAADSSFTHAQLARFERALAQAPVAGLRERLLVHAAASAATLRFPEARFDLCRPGLALYGIAPDHAASLVRLEPALALTSRIVQVRAVPAGTAVGYGGAFVVERDTHVAVVSCGYHDGYPVMIGRPGVAANGTQAGVGDAAHRDPHVLVRGRAAPLLGRVMMDYLLVDVGRVPQASVGDRVTLIGRDAERSIGLCDVARWAGTIPYDVACRVGPRVRRIVVGEPAPSERAEGASGAPQAARAARSRGAPRAPRVRGSLLRPRGDRA